MPDWNDLSYFLAVARHGSTLAAARSLGVNQTTVARRIEELERALGLRLFDRLPKGYRLTEDGTWLLPQVERVGAAVKDLEDGIAARQRQLTATVRVTTTELLAAEVVAPLLSELRTVQPALRLELMSEDRRVDLVRGEADIALRVGSRPVEASIVCSRVGHSAWSFFCSRDYAARRGRPFGLDSFAGHDLVGGAGALAELSPLRWLAERLPGASFVVRCNSVPNLVAAARAGLGITPLPHFVASGEAGLLPCLPGDHDLLSEIWLAYRETQRDDPAIRFVVDALAARLRQVAPRLHRREPWPDISDQEGKPT
jgi:DNA-binding transcriptional LysR family regulator